MTQEAMKLICHFYELNGIVKTMSDIAEEDERYYNPATERIESKMKEIMGFIENGGA